MKEYKEINNTKYHISRIFSGETTTAMLIANRVRDEKNNLSLLESGTAKTYNIYSGSIQSKEGL